MTLLFYSPNVCPKAQRSTPHKAALWYLSLPLRQSFLEVLRALCLLNLRLTTSNPLMGLIYPNYSAIFQIELVFTKSVGAQNVRIRSFDGCMVGEYLMGGVAGGSGGVYRRAQTLSNGVIGFLKPIFRANQ